MKRVLFLLISIILGNLVLGQTVSIGDILCTDGSTVKPEQYAFSGKTAMGIVFYVDSNDSHGWAVALDKQSSSIKWCSTELYGYDIPNLPNYENARTAMHDLNGYTNTGIIRSQGNSSQFPAAWAVDYDNGWYLPSAGQLRHLFSYISEINASMQIVGGTALPYHTNNYWWASTEITECHAYDMNTGGNLGDYIKDNHINYPSCGIGVRQIRDFTIPNPIHPTYHIGDLITNDDGSQGILFYITPDQTDGWMVALNDVSSYAQWGIKGNVPNLPDQTCAPPFGALLDETDGFTNTGLIRGFEDSQNIAAHLVDFGNGWYLPTGGQLLKLFGTLPFIENKLQLYGNTLAEDYYWSSSEANDLEAFALCCVPTANVRSGHCIRKEKSQYSRVRAVKNIQLIANPPTVDGITTPEPICPGTSLDLTIPQTQFATSQGWQLSPTPDFSSPLTYNGEPIGFDHNGWYLRYVASNALGTVYSNMVVISVWPTYTTSFNITSCTDYTWNGTTYTQPGIYEQTLSTIYGCDSVVTLHLSMDSINKREIFMTGCDSIAYNDITYMQSGHYEQLVPGSTGCDTIIDLFLNINHTPYVGQIHGESLIYYKESGEFVYSIDTVEGCYGYEWRIDNDWPLTTDFNSSECSLNINHAAKGTLTVRVYTECGYVERSLRINHDAWPWIVVWPNPNNGEFNLGLYGMKGKAVVEVYNYLGQRIDCFNVDADIEGTTIPYSLKGKAAGVYILAVTHNYQVITKKVVKSTPALYGVPIW